MENIMTEKNTMTEKEKQMNGDWFYINDPELKKMRVRCNKLIDRLNSLDNSRKEERRAVLKELFGHVGENANIKSGFHCDYGCNIYIGNNVFSNYDCVFLDVGRIEIGDDTKIGPQVGIYTAVHPLDPVERKKYLEKAMPVKIGKNCWIGGNAVINPGVTLGDNVVVGSGAVVTKSFGDNVILAGVPAKIIGRC